MQKVGDVDRPQNHFSKRLGFTLVLMVALAVAFVVYTQSERRIDRANERRLRSFLLADELRQSSDDLTRMVRTYVVTGDPAYRQNYQAILDIRNGRQARPPGYERIYWDLKESQRPVPDAHAARAIPLLELMKANGFTDEELGKLKEAKSQSDALAAIEVEAMNLIHRTGVNAEESREQALAMLHDLRYHEAKVAIMAPIDECYRLMDERTLQMVRQAERNAAWFRYLFVALSLWLIFLLWRVHATLRHTLGGSVEAVYAGIAGLGRGNFSEPLPVPVGRENSIMGWLTETQSKLRALDAAEKQAENALRESEEKFRAIANYAASWECWFGSDGTLLWMNEQAMTLVGFSVDELKADPDMLALTVDPEDLAMVRASFQEALNGGEGKDFEFRLKRIDGTTVWVSVAWCQMLDAHGCPNGFRTSGQDISDRKRAEAERERMQQRLQQSQRLELVGQLAGGVAHEFNNKLQAILGFTELLNLELRGQVRSQEYLTEIRRAAQQSAKIAVELLGFARKQMVAPRTLDVKEAIVQALNMLEKLLRKPARLVWLPGPDVWLVRLDPAQLTQVLGDLVINAREAIAEEGRITISAHNFTCHAPAVCGPDEMLAGDYVMISVTDNGRGMTEEVLAHLFEPFFTTKAVGQGTGLGLATVYGIVKQNHGFIKVQSAPGRGTTFDLFFPRLPGTNG